MNFEWCWWDRRGVFATVLVLLVFVTSVAWTPARTDTPILFVAGLVPSAPVLYHADTPPANAILPAGSTVPAPVFEQLLPEELSGALYAGVLASAGVAPLRFLQRKHPGFLEALPFPRHVFLQVYRC